MAGASCHQGETLSEVNFSTAFLFSAKRGKMPNCQNPKPKAASEHPMATEKELRQKIRELSTSEKSLRWSEELYRNVVNGQTELICRFTPDRKLTFVNDAYCRYFGLDKKVSRGKPHTVAIPVEDLPHVKKHLASLTPENPVATIEHRIQMPDGNIRWQQWSDQAIFGEKNGFLEFQSVGRDITERKQAEIALFEANKKLNLLSVITRHDILNQLTGLRGYLGLIEETIHDSDSKELVDKAMRAGDIIRHQITFTRQYQDIGVRYPLWQNVFDCVMSVCQGDVFAHVSIERSLQGIEIFADPLVEMVFYNLFENAEMHGRKVTRIQVSGEISEDGFFDLIISDNGIGIPDEDKREIFSKGFGTHTGLGLFLVKEVLAITGLTIRETGKYGNGAVFMITVPAGMFRKTGVQTEL